MSRRHSRKHRVEDDEELARKLQLEEEMSHSNQRLSEYEHELKDLELARQFARMDMQESFSLNEGRPNNEFESRSRHTTPTEVQKNSKAATNFRRSHNSSISSISNDNVEDMLENARKLQEQAFRDLNSSKSDAHSTTEGDHELARKLQEMEDSGLSGAGATYPGSMDCVQSIGRESTSDARLSNRDRHGSTASDESTASFSAEELLNKHRRRAASSSNSSCDFTADEHLARVMHQSGDSIRNMTKHQIEKEISRLKPGAYAVKPREHESDDARLARLLERNGQSMDNISNTQREDIIRMSRQGRGSTAQDDIARTTRSQSPPSEIFRRRSSERADQHPRSRTQLSGRNGNLDRLQTARSLSPTIESTVVRGDSQHLYGTSSLPLQTTDARRQRQPMSPKQGTMDHTGVLGCPISASVEEAATPREKKKKKFGFLSFGNRNAKSADTGSAPAGAIPAAIPPPSALPFDTPGAPPRGILPPPMGNIPESPPRHQQRLPTSGSPIKGSSTCFACGKMGGSFVQALGKKYHTGCFRCFTCHQRIDVSTPFAFSVNNSGTKHAHHRECYTPVRTVQCTVCRVSIPPNDDGTVPYVTHPFFESEQMCTWHADDRIRRCNSCHRFEPRDAPFVDLGDAGRCVCFSCCRTVVMNNADIQPLWRKVLSFFENHLELPIWSGMSSIPILVVDSDALTSQMSQNGSLHDCSGNVMTRGLCLTDRRSLGRFKMTSMRFNQSSSSFEAQDTQQQGFTYFDVSSHSSNDVFAILCLSGMPRDLTASVLAHEALHAWIKLHPENSRLSPLIEEGCAQLVAFLLLRDGLEPATPPHPSDSGPSDEKLRQYFRFSIETEKDDTYGGGYRRAAKAYSEMGLVRLLNYVLQYNEFP